MKGYPAVYAHIGHATNTFSVICFMPSLHLCPTISVVDCVQEIPQLQFPSWDDRPVAVSQERLCPGWIHQHLCSRLGDWAGLRRCRQAPQPILSTAALLHPCCRALLLPKDSGFTDSSSALPRESPFFFFNQAASCWYYENFSLLSFVKVSAIPVWSHRNLQTEMLEMSSSQALGLVWVQCIWGQCWRTHVQDCHWPLMPISEYLLTCIRTCNTVSSSTLLFVIDSKTKDKCHLRSY